MTLSDWTSLLCNELSKRFAKQVEPRANSSRFERITRPLDPQPQSGSFHISLGDYGLHVMADEPDVIVWLLDSEGRTKGPIWCDRMATESIPAAAAEIMRVVKEAPSQRSFTMWPPTSRDLALEDRVNALWQIVQRKIDEIQLASRNEDGVEDAIVGIERYIDDLAQKDENAALSEYAVPFKAVAAAIIRDKAKTGVRDVDGTAES